MIMTKNRKIIYYLLAAQSDTVSGLVDRLESINLYKSKQQIHKTVNELADAGFLSFGYRESEVKANGRFYWEKLYRVGSQDYY